MRDSFSEYHPFINLIYFVFVIGFSLVLTHPLAQGISLVCAIVYAVSINGKKSVIFLLKYCLPMILLTAIINPAFNHEGATTLLFFPNGNPLTLESILYGFSAGVMIITTLLWFSSFNRVMTTDKFIYLFGKVIPALSLVLSMSLRFVPKFKSQMQTVTEAQRSMGRDVSSGSLLERTKTAIHIFSIMITWSLENAIETADSMKSRGYGLKGRTAFSIYRFDERDKYALLWLSFCGLFIIAGSMLSAFEFKYFPDIRYAAFDMTTIPFYCVYSAFCITPVILNYKEERKWKTSVSEM
ncbi:MAG: energy-coupling factor transporter transmembrane protein EcfT [Clostridia bacterium]|nr:energy-coupling factor transporter transmembrane protein EcfT [Clostridia bacterium]